MLLPCLASCEQFSETSNNSGLVGNAFKKKTTEHCKKRWILTYQSPCANKCTRKQFTSIQHLLSAHMGHGIGVGNTQAYKREGSCPSKVHMPTKTMCPGMLCFVLKNKLNLLNLGGMLGRW